MGTDLTVGSSRGEWLPSPQRVVWSPGALCTEQCMVQGSERATKLLWSAEILNWRTGSLDELSEWFWGAG